MFKQFKALVRGGIKKIFGEKVFINYHKQIAKFAASYYGNPSKKMFVVLVTGTKGKTSTMNFMWHVLTNAGFKVGLISTANIKIGEEEILNWYHMTMPGRFLLQGLLNKMEKAGCDIVLVETTSEGIKMGRHIGIFYDVCVFTNLHPEHLKSHNNSFEEYRNTKGIIFRDLIKLPKKVLPNFESRNIEIKKTIIANADNPESYYFLNFPADTKYSYGVDQGEYKIKNVLKSSGGVSFSLVINGEETFFEIPLLGEFNIFNAMPAILLANSLNVSKEKIIEGVKKCAVIPGRMEIIDEGQDFTVIVDYAHEGVSMRNALLASRMALRDENSKLVAVYGAEGGGRDLSKRETMSKAVSELAHFAIATLSDPFDADPKEINDDIVNWLEKFGMKKGENVFEYIDRREAIRKAISLCKAGDVILFASKGAEQSIIFKDHVESWDDRVEVRKALREIL